MSQVIPARIPAITREVITNLLAIYGLAWLAGASLIGLLYERSITLTVIFIGTAK